MLHVQSIPRSARTKRTVLVGAGQPPASSPKLGRTHCQEAIGKCQEAPDTDRPLRLERQPIGTPVRPSTTIGEPFQTTIFVPIEDFVAGFARDIELPAQHRDPLPSSSRSTSRSRS